MPEKDESPARTRGLIHGMVGSVDKDAQPRVAIVVAVLTAEKDSLGEMRTYNGLLE